MNAMSISRRKFAHLLGVGAAAAIIKPAISLEAEPTSPSATTAVVRLSANENPYGISPKGLKGMMNAFELANRYPDEQNDVLVEKLAKLNGVGREQILLGDGSGEILQLAAETFTGSNQGKLVAADPTFEAILNHAAANAAEVVKVPLTGDFAHDLTKMAAGARGGLIYICNPNNPTASVTPKNELRDFIGRTPRQTMILVDEAYFHYADSADYETMIPLVADHPNLLVTRTFSKVYGMAGLRCGYCVAQKEVIGQLRSHQAWDSVNIMALAAAATSLDDADQVTTGRRLNHETRAFVIHELEKMGYKSIPSQANFIMTDVKRPIQPLIQALKQRNVYVGRLFPALPNHMRITIGKKTEMEAFLSAFQQVMV
jgi:histidinol-phosphate aminotransferase